jgi:farnesyl diphosphate synthase
MASVVAMPEVEKKSSNAGGREKFMEVYKQLKKELLSDSELATYTDESRAWVEEMLDYTVPGGKLNRGLSVVDSLKLLKEEPLSETDTFNACALGWCIEWLQGYFLVLDDIMDSSVTRRGQPCWYRVPKVGHIAINDGIILRTHISRILKTHFRQSPIYVELVDLFNDVEYQTASGQMLDLITTPAGEVDLARYVLPTYLRIVKYKTAYYSFYLPVACALLLAGETNVAKFEAAKEVLVQMGTYFQVQDDFLDCYGAPEVIGKIGTDIEDTKCSWLIVQALKRANESQKKTLKENYGKKDPKCVAVVKRVYNELELEKVFEDYERDSYQSLISTIESQEDKSLQVVLKSFLAKIYKRSK